MNFALCYRALEVDEEVEQQQAEPPKENRQSTESGSLSILSPFDEKEEWNKISAIIESFGDDIGKDIKDSTTPNNCELDATNNTVDAMGHLRNN